MTKQLKVSGSTLRSRSPEEKGKIVNQVVEHIWPLIEQENTNQQFSNLSIWKM